MTSPRRLLVGLAAGVLLGALANGLGPHFPWILSATSLVAEPVGKIFLRLLLMLVLPLAFSALVLGVGEIQPKQLGRVGLKTLGLTVVVSLIAVLLGVTLVQLIEPGRGMTHALGSLQGNAFEAPKAASLSPIDLLVGIVPVNPIAAAASGDMLGFLVFALAFGIAMAGADREKVGPLRRVIEGIFEVSMGLIERVLKLAPLGIGALLCAMVAKTGIGIVEQLGKYVLVVVLGLGIHLFVVYSVALKWLAKMSPVWFFRQIRLVLSTAFSTASSNATLPTALRVAEEDLRLPRDVSRFVLTAGASMNQNGTALFEGVTVLFLAQAYGIELGTFQQVVVMVICVLAGLGTAGVPAGSLPVIATILSLVGVPPQAVGLILGVDRLLDMCRTTVNVAGDLVLAAIVARSETSRLSEDSEREGPSAPSGACEAQPADLDAGA